MAERSTRSPPIAWVWLAGQQATYYGGHYRKSPARIRVPSAGGWHVIVVPSPGGRVHARVSVSG